MVSSRKTEKANLGMQAPNTKLFMASGKKHRMPVVVVFLGQISSVIRGAEVMPNGLKR